jgi:hypothetical protein
MIDSIDAMNMVIDVLKKIENFTLDFIKGRKP